MAKRFPLFCDMRVCTRTSSTAIDYYGCGVQQPCDGVGVSKYACTLMGTGVVADTSLDRDIFEDVSLFTRTAKLYRVPNRLVGCSNNKDVFRVLSRPSFAK